MTDHDLFGSDAEQDCSYTVFAVVFFFFFTLTRQPIEAVKKGGNRAKVTQSSGNNSITKESFFLAEIKSNQTLYCKVADKDEDHTRMLLLDLRCAIETETGGREKNRKGLFPSLFEELTDRLKIC